jgi:hypothetical protein
MCSNRNGGGGLQTRSEGGAKAEKMNFVAIIHNPQATGINDIVPTTPVFDTASGFAQSDAKLPINRPGIKAILNKSK